MGQQLNVTGKVNSPSESDYLNSPSTNLKVGYQVNAWYPDRREGGGEDGLSQ